MSVESVGIVAKIASVLFLALSGAFAKHLMESLPPNQIVWMIYLGYVVCMAPVTLLCRGREVIRPFRPHHQVIRSVLAISVNFLFIASLGALELSEAVSLLYIYPFMMCLGAIWFLGERGSAGLWLALCAGALGVVLVVQPSSRGVNFGHALVLIVAIALSARAILHRHDSGRASPLVAVLWERCVGAVIASVSCWFYWAPIPDEAILPIFGLIAASISAQVFFVVAISRAPLVVLAPFTFWEVIFALLLSILAFGAVPNALALVGTLVLTISGFVMSYLRMRRRQATVFNSRSGSVAATSAW